jgi:tRNA U34 5-methylaminomethyl-2-thiouridine-forming methyltransferase MnmC
MSRQRSQFSTDDASLNVVVSDDGSRTLRCNESGVTWHSESGALPESRLVFLENSGLIRLLETQGTTRVLEIGFGTGLNFWLAASAAIKRSAKLKYVSVEPRLLSFQTVNQLEHSSLDECQPAFDLFSDSIFGKAQRVGQGGLNDGQIDCCHAGVELEVLVERFEDSKFDNLKLPEGESDCSTFESSFEIVFHDPFDPAVAPKLWSEHTLSKLFQLLVPGGCLVTYCVKSIIQKRLKAVGFQIEKTKGPEGGKREVLIARKR